MITWQKKRRSQLPGRFPGSRARGIALGPLSSRCVDTSLDFQVDTSRLRARERSISMRDIVVIGGSAGAFDCVCTVLRQLPSDLPASLFVVVHVPETNSTLSGVLSRCGELHVGTAKNGEKVKHGHVYVAPGGSHMVLN